jgi:hypothetical protein
MKTILALLFVSTPAFAFPALGDKVVFAVEVEGGGATQTGTLTQELTEHNEAQKSWLEVETLVLGSGAPQVTQAWHKENELQSPQKLGFLLRSCSIAGGKSTSVEVPAGHFDVCLLANGPSATYWIGLVPFGVVEFVTLQNGKRNTGVLTSVRAP